MQKRTVVSMIVRLLAVLILVITASGLGQSGDVQAQAGETCLILQPGPALGKDAYLKQEKVDERRGGDSELRIKTEIGKLTRGVLQFDLSGVPSGAVISSARLSLFVKGASGGPVSISAHRLTAAWNEAEVTWNARDKAAGLNWAAPGGDMEVGAAAAILVDDTKNVWRTWTVTGLVNEWIANPAANFGLILQSPVTNPKTEKIFKSSDDGTATQRPMLEICYNAGLILEPNHISEAPNGQVKSYAHTLKVGNISGAVAFGLTSSQGWPVRLYTDFNGNGVKDPTDTQITGPVTVGANSQLRLLVQVDVPFNAAMGVEDTVTLTATLGAATATAMDRTRVGRLIMISPSHTQYATAGSVVFYGHTITNNGNSTDCVNVAATSSQGWTVLLWEDTNRNGVHEVDNPNEPALTNPVCIAPGSTYALVAEVRTPPGGLAGLQDVTSLTVTSGNEPGRTASATDTTVLFVNAPPVIDGKYDDVYRISPSAQQVCYSAGNQLFGKLATFYSASENAVYMTLAISKDFVDNTYGTNTIGWPSNNHTFSQLVGSDRAQFWGYNSQGVKVLDFDLDYISTKSGTPSGYASLGLGGDGGMNTGNAAHILQWGTSLDYDLNSTGYCVGGNCSGLGTNLLLNSPATTATYAPNATYPNWIYDVIYEVKIDAAAFGAAGFGSLEIPYIHASPSKTGNNTVYPEPGICPGRIGDFVWHDMNSNGIQDIGEPGIPGVQVRLYRDNGDGLFDPLVDTLVGTQTTNSAGRYFFEGLTPNDYFVDVVDATLPAGLYNTTNNDPTSLISLGEGQEYLEADFGYSQGAPIGDFVWNDQDLNGVQDANEPGVAGVTVRLYDGANNLLAVTTTDANGYYLFPNRGAGSYQVEFVLPPGYAFTAQNQGGDGTKDSDVNQNTGRTAVFTTQPGQPDLNRDAGLTRHGAIGDFVWFDANTDGIQDVGEPGIANVTLDLYRGGTKVASTTTDADGGYLFTGLPTGAYVVDVTDLNGVLDGLIHVVANQSQTDPTAAINLGAGEIYKDADFGYYDGGGGTGDPGALIGDTVWYDGNGDGIQQPGEPGIPGIQVCATPVGVGALRCAITNSNGVYLLPVMPGVYTVAPVNPPAGFTPTTATSQTVTVAPLDRYLDADFGYTSPALGRIGNLVFEDKNKDGLFNGADTPLGGVSVSLIQDSNDNGLWEVGEPIIATTTTAADLGADTGNYLFTGVPQGAYLVHVTDTNGVLVDYVKSFLGVLGSDGHNQPDPYRVVLGAGGVNLSADFGYYRADHPATGVIGNQIWTERDGDGLFDPNRGDVGQPGVTVELYKDGDFYAATTSGASGDYSFTSLPAGSYTVAVTDDYDVLAAFAPTTLGPNPGSDNNNQQQPYAVSLPEGGVNLTADFGYIQLGAIGDYVWYDADADGVQDLFEPGIGNVTLALSRNGVPVATTTTGADGGYIFTDLLPGNYVVDVTDLNNALAGLMHTLGPQSQPDPTGVIALAPGVIYRDADFGYVKQPVSNQAILGDLVWYDGDGDGIPDAGEPGIPGITVCATPKDGGADLCAVTNSAGIYLISVPPGAYFVTVTNPPAGYTLTTEEVHGPVTVAAGQQYLEADFGYTSPDLAALGGTVWQDINNDGELDAGEAPIPSVSVDLIQDSNNNGVWDSGEPIRATATTDQKGDYLFAGLPPGDYLLIVSDTQNVLDDFTVTEPGPNPGQDNNNQLQPYPVSLSPGQINTTGDFGYVQNQDGDSGVIGNQVWYEADGNGLYNPDAGDVGVAGVTVALYRNSQLYAVTTTGASGDYVFTGLPGGNYMVQVTDQFGVLTSYILTVYGPTQGQDNHHQVQPYEVALPQAGLNMTADFGYTRPGAIGDFVWYDTNGDGIQNVSEPGIPNVTLDLYREGDLYASTTTDADGGYLFADLPPGAYSVDVTDLYNRLAGLTHLVANQSQADPTMTINLGAGEVYKDADFGYFTAVSDRVILGDFVWYDANGDGFQQPNEPGIPGVTVQAVDGAGTTYTQITDSNGYYLFNLPAGGYTVAPVNPPAGLRSTTPIIQESIILLAGESYLDADFGYTDDTGSILGVIGNLVFEDKNRDGLYNGSDTPLGGVSVSLIRDLNGNGEWDEGEPIIATTTTYSALDVSQGNYRFAGVPAGNYLVHVSDTNAVLTNFVKSPLGTPGANNQNQIDPYAVILGAGGSNLTADFGYYRADRPNIAIIGNQVWMETDADGLFEPTGDELGQAGVTIELYKDGDYYGKTTTGASGDYSFPSLPGGTYTVTVSDDFNVLAGFDLSRLGPIPGADNNNQAQPYQIVLPSNGVNLTADFGYAKPTGGLGSSSIGNLVWADSNNNGRFNAGEAAIGGAVVRLWYDADMNCVLDPAKDVLVGSRTTGGILGIGNTNYVFAYENGLRTGNYLVEVTDPNSVLVGATKTEGLNVGVNENSQPNPYCLQNFNATGVGDTNLTADFGYLLPDSRFTVSKVRLSPSPVRPNEVVQFAIRVTNTGTTQFMTLSLEDVYDTEYIRFLSAVPAPVNTIDDGAINWTDLLSGRDPLLPGASVEVIVNFVALKDTGDLPDSRTVNTAVVSGIITDPDGNGPAPTNPTPLPPQSSQDVVAIINPTATLVSGGEVALADGGAVARWQTISEADVAGFNLLRAAGEGETLALNPELIVAQKAGQAEGAAYEWVDVTALAEMAYIYSLEIIRLDGSVERYALGSVAPNASGQLIFLPLIGR